MGKGGALMPVLAATMPGIPNHAIIGWAFGGWGVPRG